MLLGLPFAQADEGLARITELGDRNLVATTKAAKPKRGPVYKSVEENEEESSGGLFTGQPLPYSHNLFFGAGLNYFDNFGLQGRYAVRATEEGFIPEINDAFYLEGGVGVTFYGTKRAQTGVTGFSAVLTGRWDFQLNEYFIFFADLGAGYNAVSNDRENDVKGGGWFPAAGAGFMVNIGNDWAFRGDVSYQFVGAGIVRRF